MLGAAGGGGARVYIWGDKPAGTVSHPNVIGMVTARLRDLPGHTGDPVLAAHYAANEILREVHDRHTVPVDKVCLIFHNFGHDDAYSEDTSGNNYAPRLRFFQNADRLELLDTSLSISDASFPVQLNAGLTNRTYRHPFLSNSTATLRQWTIDFLTEYTLIQQQRIAQQLPPLPDPARLHMDVEPFMVMHGHRNAVFMLKFLSEQQQIWGTGPTDPNPQPGWDVPGYPVGTSLWDLYEAARIQNGWPATIPLNDSVDGNDPDNRAYMLWWYEVTQRASVAQLEASLYSVLRSAWPECKFSNYHDARYDGQVNPTGWFMDRDNSGTPGDDSDDVFVKSNTYPRSYVERQWTGGRMVPVVDSGHDPLKKVRWHASNHTTTTDFDAPRLYQTNKYQFWGWSGQGWNRPMSQGGPDGHQQPDLYLPGEPLHGELLQGEFVAGNPFPTTMRLSRQEVEAIIDSFGGANQARVTPWLQLPWTDYVTANRVPNPCDNPNLCQTDYDWHLVKGAEVRAMLSMLRGKNLSEILFWGWNSRAGQNWTFNDAWNEVVGQFSQVYASRIAYFGRTVGTKPTTAPADHASMLEFTLLQGASGVVAIESAPTGPTNHGTDLVVKVNGLQQFVDSTFEITLECFTNIAGVKGELYVWDWNSKKWNIVETSQEEGWEQYYFYTDDHSSRRVFVFDNLGHFVTQAGEMMLKLVHTHATSPFVSKYDHLLVVPIPLPGGSSGGEGLVATESDANYDDSVDENDLLLFLDNWASGSQAADADMDGDVDDADLARFLSAYASGT